VIRKIIYTTPAGALAIVTPVRNTRGDEALTDEAIEQRAWDKLPADAVNPQYVEPALIPSNRAKRRSWRLSSGVIVEDAAVEAAAKDQDAIRAIDGTDRLQFEHLFELENRVRVLEGQQPILKQQYRNALIAKWKALNP